MNGRGAHYLVEPINQSKLEVQKDLIALTVEACRQAASCDTDQILEMRQLQFEVIDDGVISSSRVRNLKNRCEVIGGECVPIPNPRKT